jgi:hypothetical protein
MTFMAALHGVDLKDSKKKSNSATSKATTMLFDSPENYAKLSKAEREQKTQDMMAQMKMFAAQTRM